MAPRADASAAIALPAAPVADASDGARAPVGRWRSVPREQKGFYAVLDGICSELSARAVGSDVLVWYGGNNALYTGKRNGPASFAGLRNAELRAIEHPRIAYPTSVMGVSLDDFVIADGTGGRSMEGSRVHHYVRGTWSKFEKDGTAARPFLDGGVIGQLGMAAANGDPWVGGSTVKPPKALNDDMMFPAMAAFPSGDVLVVGRLGEQRDGALVARHWSPTKPLSQHPLDKLAPGKDGYVSVGEFAPDEVYVSSGTRILRWDGSTFRAVGALTGKVRVNRIHRAALDDLVVIVEREDVKVSDALKLELQRVTPGGTTIIPTPEPISSIDGVERGAMWTVGASGKLYRRDGEAWTVVPLPTGPFSQSGVAPKAKSVTVAGKDDVLVVASYWEKAPGWKEQELHTALFRTKPVAETLRCNEPDPENNNVDLGRGFQSWPPLADATCTTPFVVLARRSKTAKTADDWPRLKAALKGAPGLGDGKLVELTSGDRTFVGAKATSFDAAKKMIDLVTKGERLRPEIVCADPEPTRTIALDAK